jgi:hypothetical protein
MGPFLYITIGGSFTVFHKDGNGSVDSGHTVISGHNEVFMIRKLNDSEEDQFRIIMNLDESLAHDAVHVKGKEKVSQLPLYSLNNL